MKLSELAVILKGEFTGQDNQFAHVSLDTRTLQPKDLYIAIRGDYYDGHDFMGEAEKCGAIAVVTHRPVKTILPQICVADTRQALFDLSAFYREKMQIPVIGITGSCGKTTTRAMLESILQQCAPVLATQKSFNNFIGVPLTLMQFQPHQQFAVIEIGANHVGEIVKLTHLVKPTIAVITNAGSAHLEGFGDLNGVAAAKGEIFQGLSDCGVAVINQDDFFADFWSRLAAHCQIITFGISQSADVMATNIEFDNQGYSLFTLQTINRSISISLPLMGIHNIRNALAAASVAVALNIPSSKIQSGLSLVKPVSQRLIEKRGYAGAAIIDDSYNANPSSVAAAIQVLAKRSGETVLVLGDMLELGDASEQLHRELGETARQSGLHRLYCYGKNTAHTARVFGKNAKHFDNKVQLISAIKEILSERVTVLVKGSKSMQMSEVANALLMET